MSQVDNVQAVTVQDQVNPPVVPNAPAPAEVDSDTYDSLFSLSEGQEAESPHPANPEVPKEEVKSDPIDPSSYEMPWQAGEYEVADQFRSFAAENGLDPATVKKLAEWYKGQEQAAIEADAGQKAQQAAEKMGEFKKAFPNFKEVAGEASKAAVILGGEGFFKTLKDNGLLTNPDVVNALLNVKKMRADGNISAVSTPAKQADPQVRAARLNELRSSPAYTNPRHPDYKKVHEEVLSFYNSNN